MKRAWLIAALSVISALAVADEYQAFLQALAQRESSNNPAKKNDSGHLGLYQMSEAALIDAGYYKPDGTANNDWRGQWTGKDGIYSAEDYLNSVAAQNNAIQAYHQKLWSYIEAEGLDQLVGQTVDGVQVTPAALLAGAHLIGAQGLANCLSTATGCADGNGTKAMSYMALFGGYDVASVTGVSWSGGGGGGSGGSTNSDLGGTGGGSGPKEYSGYPLSGYTAPSASEAFSRGAGVEMARIRQFVLETLSVILLLWLAWISLAQYSNWRNGVASMMQMQSSIVRAAVLVSLMLIIFFAV
jgi:integrating conjugative element protein (TIGR03758 family)